MRFSCLALLIALAGCPSGSADRGLASEDGAGNGSGSGAGGGLGTPAQCGIDSDCVPAGPRCCDCPTYAVPSTDPVHMACADVTCGPMSCGSPMYAACEAGACVLACSPVACDASVSCPNGFATDANGCLTCACAAPADIGNQCAVDGDCARVKDDCCGCTNGGFDTAVPVGDVASHEAALMCPANPVCPGGSTCAADLAARCVQGTCSLVSGATPVGACGRPDLPACSTGQGCTVNANDQATMYGVGVCQP